MRELFAFLAGYMDRNEAALAAVTGGGGKTSLLYGLGRELAASRRVLLSTTTKIFRPTACECRDLFLGPAKLCAAFIGTMPPASLLAAAAGEREGKLIGYAPEEVCALAGCGAAGAVVAECDGSRGRSLKFYEEWEPPVPRSCGCLFAVAGIDALGETADEEHIFRADRFRALHGMAEGAKVSAADYLSYLRHPEGPLKNAPRGAKKMLLLNKWERAGEEARREFAEAVPSLLESYDAAAFVSMRLNILYDCRER